MTVAYKEKDWVKQLQRQKPEQEPPNFLISPEDVGEEPVEAPRYTIGPTPPRYTIGPPIAGQQITPIPKSEYPSVDELLRRRGILTKPVGEELQREIVLGVGLALIPGFGVMKAGIKGLGWASRIARLALTPPALAEKAVILPFKIAGKAIAKASKTYGQLLEGHRIQRTLEMGRKEYEKIAKEVTGKTSMKNMTREEADKFLDALGRTQIELPTNMPFGAAKIETKALAAELAEYMGKPKPRVTAVVKETERKGFWTSTTDKYKDFAARSDRMERIMFKADDFTEGKLTQTFINSVDDATDNVLRNKYNRMEQFRAVVKENGFTMKNLFGNKMEVMRGLRLTTGERIGVYLNSLNKDGLRHVKFGNFGGLIDELGSKGVDNLIRDITQKLTPQEKAIATWLRRWSKEETPKVAEAYRKATGKRLKTVDEYWRLIVKGEENVDIDPVIRSLEEGFGHPPSVGIAKGFTKARTGKATQSIELDAFDVFLRQLHEVEHYKSFYPVIRDLQRIYKNPSFTNSFKDKVGKSQYDVLGNWITAVADTDPMRARNASERLLRTLRVNSVTAVLGFNITTALKQFPSFLIGAAEIGNVPALKGLMKTMNPVMYKETQNIMKRLAPQMRARVIERELAETQIMRSVGKKLAGQKSAREIFMGLTIAMDKFAVTSLWRGAFDEGLRKGLTEVAAAKMATKGIRKTQPFFSVKDIPEYWRGGEGMRMLTMFQNQLNQYWNYFRYDTLGAYMAGRTSTAKVLTQITEAFVLPALMIGAISRSKPQQDAKEVVGDLSRMAFASVPLVGQFVSGGIAGFRDNQGQITTQALGLLQQTAYDISNAEWDEVIKDIPELGGYLAGIPVAQPRRTIDGMIDIAQGKSSDWLRLIWSEYSRGDARKLRLVVPEPSGDVDTNFQILPEELR